MTINPKDLDQLIRLRRSVFPTQYTGEQVDDTIINQMLENANWAPTHKLTEPWRFVVFKGAGIKSFADHQADRYVEKMGAEADSAKETKLRTKPLKASHIIAIGMKRHSVVPEMEEVAAVGSAVQNMQLTAATYGVGCYWSTGGVTFYDGVNADFGLEPDDMLMGFLYVGHVKDDKVLGEGKRQAIDDKVNWVVE